MVAKEREVRSIRRAILNKAVGERVHAIILGLSKRDKESPMSSVDLGMVIARPIAKMHDAYHTYEGRRLPLFRGMFEAQRLEKNMAALFAMMTRSIYDGDKVSLPPYISKPRPEVLERVKARADYYFNDKRLRTRPQKAVEKILVNNEELVKSLIKDALTEWRNDDYEVGLINARVEHIYNLILQSCPAGLGKSLAFIAESERIMNEGFKFKITDDLESIYQEAYRQGISSCMVSTKINNFYNAFHAKVLAVYGPDKELVARAVFWTRKSFVNENIPDNLCVVDRVYYSGKLGNILNGNHGEYAHLQQNALNIFYRVLSASLQKAGYLPLYATESKSLIINDMPLVARGEFNFNKNSYIHPSVDNMHTIVGAFVEGNKYIEYRTFGALAYLFRQYNGSPTGMQREMTMHNHAERVINYRYPDTPEKILGNLRKQDNA